MRPILPCLPINFARSLAIYIYIYISKILTPKQTLFAQRFNNGKTYAVNRGIPLSECCKVQSASCLTKVLFNESRKLTLQMLMWQLFCPRLCYHEYCCCSFTSIAQSRGTKTAAIVGATIRLSLAVLPGIKSIVRCHRSLEVEGRTKQLEHPQQARTVITEESVFGDRSAECAYSRKGTAGGRNAGGVG